MSHNGRNLRMDDFMTRARAPPDGNTRTNSGPGRHDKSTERNTRARNANPDQKSNFGRSFSGERSFWFWPDVAKNLEKFTYFWRADSPFSQHHPASFRLDGRTFNCSEQYYMFMKAVTFKDKFIENKIMSTGDPARQKSIAKQIPNFVQEIWDEVSYDVVKRANIAKFGQNPRLLNFLVATRGTTLVEASPGDKNWGIGMAADHSGAMRQVTWKGNNKLGRILTEIRDDEFKDFKYEPVRSVHDKFYGYSIFWRSSSPFTPKYLAPFTADGGQPFVSLFHFMMFKSADIFGKRELANKIAKEMRQNNIEKLAYSEEINTQVWKSNLKKVLIEGNFYKFNDNNNLKALLLGTNGKVLVYQSRSEGIGNGLEEDDHFDSVIVSCDWKNENMLGLLLTFMRDEWIKNPNITLKEFLDMDMSTFPYNLEQIDHMHMSGREPPELPNLPDQSSVSSFDRSMSRPDESHKSQTSKDNMKRDGSTQMSQGKRDSEVKSPEGKKPKPSPAIGVSQPRSQASNEDEKNKQTKQDSSNKQAADKKSKVSHDIEAKQKVQDDENKFQKNEKSTNETPDGSKKVNKTVDVAKDSETDSSDDESNPGEQKRSYALKQREKKFRKKERDREQNMGKSGGKGGGNKSKKRK